MARILIVRLGAMGDILHALPAVSALRAAEPRSEIAWVLEPKWFPLLQNTVAADHLIPFNRRDALSVWTALRWLSRWQPDRAIDFQGLIKSGLVALLSRAPARLGFAKDLREEAAGIFYTHLRAVSSTHVIDRNAELLGLKALPPKLPQGHPDGTLPETSFVLAAPFAGWAAKQWPIERYLELAPLLKAYHGLDLVLNVAPHQPTPPELLRHESNLAGLIHATRRADAVLGLDSGPLHLAAALGKPGLALFGPTDPARNGPYYPSIATLRAPGAITTYKRDNRISPSMDALDVQTVYAALRPHLA